MVSEFVRPRQPAAASLSSSAMTPDAVVASTPITFLFSAARLLPKQTPGLWTFWLLPLSGHTFPAPLLKRAREGGYGARQILSTRRRNRSKLPTCSSPGHLR